MMTGKNNKTQIPVTPEEFEKETEERYRREIQTTEARLLPGGAYHLRRTLTGAGYDLPEHIGDFGDMPRYFPSGEPYLFPGLPLNVNNLL